MRFFGCLQNGKVGIKQIAGIYGYVRFSGVRGSRLATSYRSGLKRDNVTTVDDLHVCFCLEVVGTGANNLISQCSIETCAPLTSIVTVSSVSPSTLTFTCDIPTRLISMHSHVPLIIDPAGDTPSIFTWFGGCKFLGTIFRV